MNDTIAAISTPLGEGGVGIIRISGNNALKIADKIFKGKITPSKAKSHTIHYGKIISPDKKEEIDEVLLMIMKKPNTYTREDIVEINAHGGIVILQKILNLIIKNGARLAEPGEFTKRAFLSGRIDLTQAEAVLDIVQAKTEKQSNIALNQLFGKLSSKINKIKKRLSDIEADIEGAIEFPDDVPEPNIKKINKILINVLKELEFLIKSGEQGKIIKEGIIIPIVGRTNVGKSSLFNALLKNERSIVTKYPGTTRDTIEEWLSIDGIPVKLIDTAGIRETKNPIEKEGVIRTKKAIEDAELILFVIDSSENIKDEDIKLLNYIKNKNKKIIGILNKCDLAKAKIDYNFDFKTIYTSALRGDNIDKIPEIIKNFIQSNNIPPIVYNIRHIEILKRAYYSIKRAKEGLKKLTLELISYEIRDAINAIGEITGETVTEEILNQIFSKFCVGK